MDWFFDKHGRDMVIMDWLKRHKETADYPKLYDYLLARRTVGYEALNGLVIAAFEAGIEFSRASKREARPPESVEGLDEQVG